MHPAERAVSKRTVVVTGGGKGIGRAIAEQCATSECGVIAVGRDERALAEVAGVRVAAEVCDVTDEQAVTALFERLGPVDVLVNSAGIAESAPLRRTTLDDWRRHFDVNATGPFLCIRAALPAMLARDSGRIVTIASTAGLEGSAYTAAYTASKHAVVGLTRVVAAEVAGTGVTANAVCPTYVRTAMIERAVDRIAASTGRSREEGAAALAAMSPLGRLLEPAEVAAAVLFLASDTAAAINGQAIVLDGGGLQR